MIEVRSNTKRVRIIYDTPYIRSLPTRLEVTESGTAGPVTRTFGPLYARRLFERARRPSTVTSRMAPGQRRIWRIRVAIWR